MMTRPMMYGVMIPKKVLKKKVKSLILLGEKVSNQRLKFSISSMIQMEEMKKGSQLAS
jgi:hypothetical protein